MRVLFLSGWFPFPPDNGSKIRVFNLIRGLSRQHEVALIVFADQPEVPTPQELQALCSEVHVVPRRPYNPSSLRAVVGLFSRRPRFLVDTDEPRMQEQLRRELGTRRYDVVVASELSTASYLESHAGVPAIFEDLELGLWRSEKTVAASPVHRLRHNLTWLKLCSYLRRLLPGFAACTVVSEAEQDLLRRAVPTFSAVHLIPNCIDLARYQDLAITPQRHTLVFAGSLHYSANYDAMGWFLRGVFPLILARMPSARVTITGDHAGLALPDSPNVILTGRLEDVRPIVASSLLSVVPIREGGGTRLKILEAMALGTPVVTTTKGAEGLDVRHGEHLLIADTPDEFADATIRLLGDPALRQELARRGRLRVAEKYDWEVVMPRFLDLIERAAAGAKAARASGSAALEGGVR